MTAYSSKFPDYLAYGTHAARPATPNSGPNVAPIYRETDTGHTFQWDGGAWIQIDGGLSNPMTTQDDLIVGGASGVPARLGKGSDGQVLTVDPTTHHLLWATPGGSSAAMTQIAQVSASGGSQATIHFASVPGTYNHLLLITSLRTTSGNNLDFSGMQFNSDTGTNYQWSGYEGNASANPALDGANAAASITHGRIAGGIAPASSFDGGTCWIYDYASTHKHKAVRAMDGLPYDATHFYTQDFAGKWINTAAITDILLTPAAGSYAQYCVATLYGVL